MWLHINNLNNLLKQIIKKLDNPNHYDKIAGSLDSLTHKGLRLNSERNTLYNHLLDDSDDNYLKA